jgi:hypothetical protein
MNQNSSVTEVTGYRLNNQSSIPSRDRDFSLYHHHVQTGFGTYPTYSPMGISWIIKLTTHLHNVPRLMCGILPPLLHTSS